MRLDWIKKFNNRGMSLVGVIVAAGIGIVVMMAMVSIVNTILDSQRSILAKDASRELVGLIRKVLSDPEICFATFGGTDPKDSGVQVDRILGPEPVSSPNKIKFKINQKYLNNLVSITGLNLKNYTPYDGVANPYVGKSDLNLSLKKEGTEIGGATMASLVFVETTLDPVTGLITGCHAVGSADSLWQISPTNMGNIYYDIGNVGVGTASPAARMHIASNSAIRHTDLEKSGKSIIFDPNVDNTNTTSHIKTDSGMGFSLFVNSNKGNGGTQALQVLNNGYVGLGTPNPELKLDVAGGIRPGDSTVVSSCNSQLEGSLRYVRGDGTNPTMMQVCQRGSGTTYSWQPLGGSIQNCALEYRFFRNGVSGAWGSLTLNGTSSSGGVSKWSANNLTDECKDGGCGIELRMNCP